MDGSDVKPDIAVLTSVVLPEGFAGADIDKLAAPGLRVVARRVPGGPSAGLELYLPTAVMVCISTAYFTGFFQKAGEDHYDLLKQTAKSMYARLAGVRVTAIGSPGKVTAAPKYSLAYSIVGELVPGLSFKLILSTEIAQDDAASGVEAFLDLIRDIHAGTIDEARLRPLLEHKPIGGVVLVTFDSASGEIVAVDPHG